MSEPKHHGPGRLVGDEEREIVEAIAARYRGCMNVDQLQFDGDANRAARGQLALDLGFLVGLALRLMNVSDDGRGSR